jgi:hypothetical protein
MVKLYEQWLAERDLSAPVPFEYEAGQAKVFADPEGENWVGEVTRAEVYKDLLDELRQAVDEKDDNKTRSLLQDARDLPLFGLDASNAWRQSMIDSPEQSAKTGGYRKHLATYAIRKIELFLEWVEKN